MAIEDVLRAGNYHLIDVREPLELEMDGHIEEAQNIPLGELEDRKQEIVNLSGTKIFFCRSGNHDGSIRRPGRRCVRHELLART